MARAGASFRTLLATTSAVFNLLLAIIVCSFAHYSAMEVDWRFVILAALLSPLGICSQFDCPLLPQPQPATTVYELKPQHIKVVMALGDSVTAGALFYLAQLLTCVCACAEQVTGSCRFRHVGKPRHQR